MGPLVREVSGNGHLWVMDKESTAAGSCVQSTHGRGHVPWPSGGLRRSFPWGFRRSRQMLRSPRSCQLGKGIHPAKATEVEPTFQKALATATAFVTSMCKTKPHLEDGGLDFGVLVPCSHSGWQGAVTKKVVPCELRSYMLRLINELLRFLNNLQPQTVLHNLTLLPVGLRKNIPL